MSEKKPWEMDWSKPQNQSDNSNKKPWEMSWVGTEPQKQEEQGNFSRGFETAMRQVPQTIGGVIGLAGDAVGSDSVKDYGMNIYNNQSKKIQDISKDSDSFTNVLNGDASLGDWATYGTGYVGGQALQAVATGGLGAFVGKKVAQAGLNKTLKEGVEHQISEEAKKQTLSKAMNRGATVGMFGSNAVQEVGSIYPEALHEAEKDGRTLDGGDLARVAGSGLVAAGIDTVTDMSVLKGVLGGGSSASNIFKRAAKTIPVAMAKEGVTEGIQTGVERWGAQQDLSNDEAIRDYVDSAALGALGGGFAGAGGAIRQVGKKEQQLEQARISQEQQAEADRIASEQQAESQIQYDNGLDFTPTSIDQDGQTEAQQQTYDNQVNFEPPAPASDSWSLGESQTERVDHGNTINYEHPALNTKEIETGSVPDYVFPTQPKPSEQMGINPNDGPMSTAAAMAVDSGITSMLNASNEVASNIQRNDNESLNNVVPSNYQSLLGSNNENSAPIFTENDQSAKENKPSAFNDSPSDQSTNIVTASENDGISKSRTAQSGVSGANQSTNNESLNSISSNTELHRDGEFSSPNESPIGETAKNGQAASGNNEASSQIETEQSLPSLNTTGQKLGISERHQNETNSVQPILTAENTISGTENSNLEDQIDIDQTQTNNITDQISQLEQQFSKAKTVPEKNKIREQVNQLKSQQAETNTISQNTPIAPNQIQTQYGDTPESVMSDVELLGDDFTIDLRDDKKKTNALNNPNYNAVQKSDGSVEIIGMKHPTTGEWVGKKPNAVSIDENAHQAATSSKNNTPEPTQAQIEAGNYKKGHIKVQGLDISIENPKGSERRGTDPDGKEWAHAMSDHYGYIKRTKGADNEHIDTYIGHNPDSNQVFIVDQLDQKSGNFDEHKVMLGFNNQEEAIIAYKANFDKGWKVGPIRNMDMGQFKDWIKNGDTSKPSSPQNLKESIENIRAEKIRQKTINDLHSGVYGKATDEQLQESLKHLNKEIAKAQKQSENEVVNGKRSTRKAVASGALDRFLKNRVDLETYIKARKNGEIEQRNDGTIDYSRNKLKLDEERKGASPLDTTFNALSVVSATRRVLSILEHLKLPATQDTSSGGLIRVGLNGQRVGIDKVGNMNPHGFAVQVISSFDGLPEVIQNKANYQDENGKTQNYDVSGVWHDGTLYVVADQVYGDSSKQLTTFDAYEELLVHEIIGHLGVQKLFGQEYKTKFQQLFNALGGMKGIRKIAQDNGVDMQQFESAYIQPYTQGLKDEIYTESDVQQALVSELFAFVAQNSKSKPFVRQKLKEVLGYIRQWFRERGFDKLLSRYNDADLMMFLSEARKAVVDRSYFGKYKNQEFSSKNDSDTPLYSRSTKSNSGSTTQQVREVLIDRFGKETIDELERQGKLEIIQDYSIEGVEGFYHNGKAVLVASNLTKESAVPTFLHELGGHAGFQNMMNQKQYQELMSQFDKLVEQANPVAMAAKVLAEREQGKNRQQLEYLPYLLTLSSTMQQRNVIQRNALQKLINNIISFVKAWAFDKFGINLNLTPDDILVLSERMVNQLKEQSSLDAVRQKYQGTSQWMTAPNGAKTQLSEQQWLQVRTPEFKKWFGDWENDAANASQVLDDNGEPKVVYHGTATEFNEFKQGHGLLGDGIYLTDNFDTADVYANIRGENGFVLPLFVNIRNAFKTSGNVSRDEFVKATSNGKYQGIVHQFDNQEYIVALKPNQVKMAEGNTGTFNSESADIRFSRSAEDVVERLGENIKNLYKGNFKLPSMADAMKYGLMFLSRMQITDIYKKILPQLSVYNDLVRQMDADKNDISAEADNIVREWAKLKDEEALANVMHEATLAQIDPAKPHQQGDDKVKYQQLLKTYNDLSPEAQAMYKTARNAYSKHYAKIREAVRERILRSALSSQRKADLLQKIEGSFGQIKGVYFPLARFGKYVVVVKNQNGDVESISRAETENEANALRAELIKKYPNLEVESVVRDQEYNALRDKVGRGFMSDLFDEVGNLGLDAKKQAELEDTLGQLYLSSMPDLSWAKHGMHRKGTAGFSNNARRAFAQNMSSGASYLAKLRYSDQLVAQLDEMEEYAKDQIKKDPNYKQPLASAVIDEMNKRHENLMNAKGNALSSLLTSMGFIYFLGLSPAAAVVNILQTPLVAYPIMGAKFGFDKAGIALLKASKDYANGVGFKMPDFTDLESFRKSIGDSVDPDIAKVLKDHEKQAYDKAVSAGVIDVTQAHDLAGVAQGEDSAVMLKIRPIMRAASLMFHHAERFNREVTFIAAYRLSKESGMADNDAYKQAVKMTYDGHFDYSASNRARFMQGNVAKVVFLFKQFGQNMIYTVARQTYQSIKGETQAERLEARRAISGILVTHAMAAGVLSLPLVTTLLAVASMFGGDDDDPWDAEVALRNSLADMTSPTFSNLVMKGLSRGTPADISGRVGLDSMFLAKTQDGLEGQKLYEQLIIGNLGATVGMGANIAKGIQELGQGNYARSLEEMLPTFAKNPFKAFRYASDGVQDKTGVDILDGQKVSSAGIVSQAIGFSPSQVRTAYEGKSAVYQQEQALKKRKSELTSAWIRAKRNDDPKGMDQAWEDIQKFNEVNPKLRINRINLMQSYHQNAKRIRDAENGVYLSKKYRDISEYGRFADID